MAKTKHQCNKEKEESAPHEAHVHELYWIHRYLQIEAVDIPFPHEAPSATCEYNPTEVIYLRVCVDCWCPKITVIGCGVVQGVVTKSGIEDWPPTVWLLRCCHQWAEHQITPWWCGERTSKAIS